MTDTSSSTFNEMKKCLFEKEKILIFSVTTKFFDQNKKLKWFIVKYYRKNIKI